MAGRAPPASGVYERGSGREPQVAVPWKARAETRNPAAGAWMRRCLRARAVWKMRARPACSGAEGQALQRKGTRVREAWVPGWAQGDLWVGAQDPGGGEDAAKASWGPGVSPGEGSGGGGWRPCSHLSCSPSATITSIWPAHSVPRVLLPSYRAEAGRGVAEPKADGGRGRGTAVGTGEWGKDGRVEGQGQQLLSRCLPSAPQQRAFSVNMCC